MTYAASIAFIVDNDISVRESEFLSRPHILVPSCLVLDLDLTLPGLHGLELQNRLATDRPRIPIIFITGGDVPVTVQAMSGQHGGGVV